MKKIIFVFCLCVVKIVSGQDSIAKKVHFGFHGNLDFSYQRLQTDYSSDPFSGSFIDHSGVVTDKYLTYSPSVDFFLQSNRCFLELGLSDFYRHKAIVEDSYDGKIVYKDFALGFKMQFNYLFLNPDKYFVAPYVGIAADYKRLREKASHAKSPDELEKHSLFLGFLNVGAQKNFKKNMFVRLEASYNFLSNANNYFGEYYNERELFYIRIAIGCNFK
jgi:hypothetical protein